MMSTANIVWFIGVLFLNWGAKRYTEKEQAAKECLEIYLWCSSCYLVLFGVSHWMFVMSYLKLAIRIKNPDPIVFKNQTLWLNLV